MLDQFGPGERDGASKAQEASSTIVQHEATIVYTSTQQLLRSRDGTTQRWVHEVRSLNQDDQNRDEHNKPLEDEQDATQVLWSGGSCNWASSTMWI